VIKDYTFCCYDCERAFVERLKKEHPEIVEGWKPADADQIARFPDYYKERTCALCGSKKKLMLSHIIPKFVGKWLKETSASGFLRAGNPSERIQDSFKINLLCEDCENLFSVWENYFAEQFFYTYQKDSSEIPYDEKLVRFTISVAWRLLRVYLYELVDDARKKGYAETALEVWKDYLLEKRTDPGPYENHIFFLDDLDTSSLELPEKFLWYTSRSVDGTIMTADNEQIFSWAKLPGILLVSSINPIEFRGWKTSKIENKGKIEIPQEITDTEVLEFLIARSRLIMKVPLSEAEQKKIAVAMTKRHDKILKSGTMKTLLTEGKRRRGNLMDKLNPAVRQLVDMLDNAKTDLITPIETRTFVELGLHLIADSLVEFSKGKAEQLEADMHEIVLFAKSTHSETSGISDLGDFVVIFHIMPNSSQRQQNKKIEDSFVRIEEDKLFSKAEEILVLAWNPSVREPPFQFALEIR
jgi:5-methylcytosine-specific restriction endonuclease McrA